MYDIHWYKGHDSSKLYHSPYKKSNSNMIEELRRKYPEDIYDIVWYKDNYGESYPSPIEKKSSNIINQEE